MDAQLEPILIPSNDRLVLFPIVHTDLYMYYKQAVASFWTVEEIDLGRDAADWETKLTDNERHFVAHILAFFAAADGLVNENILGRFASEVQLPEARVFYASQAFFESIHSEAYSLLIDTLIKNPEEKTRLLQGVETVPSIRAKADWVLTWIASDKPFAERLVAFACVEGISFSGAFCSIFWLKRRNLLHGLTFSNELISRDEGLHTDFACALYGKLQHPLSHATIVDIVTSCVDLEKQFITEALPCALIGMNATEMQQYIEFVADRLLVALGCAKHWDTPNPFAFMDQLSLRGKTNFFEKRTGEYARAGVLASAANKNAHHVLSVDADF